jgi:hypothetical protein
MGKFFKKYHLLDDIGISTNTNKASLHKCPNDNGKLTQGGGLLIKYEHFLSSIRFNSNLKILELGAGEDNNMGASLRCWKRYFNPDAEIHVADAKKSSLSLLKEGFHVHVCDLGNEESLKNLASWKWDFVLDDASHIWSHQKKAFKYLFESVNSGGIYIIEDLCTSSTKLFGSEYNPDNERIDPATYFSLLARMTITPSTPLLKIFNEEVKFLEKIDMICMMQNSCIIIKD